MKVKMLKRAMWRVLTRDCMLFANGSPSIGSRGFTPNYWSKENLITGADRITGAKQPSHVTTVNGCYWIGILVTCRCIFQSGITPKF